MNYLALRFDVDTHKCITSGVDNLLDLAKKYDNKFTFYVNTGRSVHPYSTFTSMLHSKKDNHVSKSAPSLSAFNKLGAYDYLYAAIVNPVIADYGKRQIQRIIDEGHELGLHGGRNHELWYQKYDEWSLESIRSEVQWGLDKLSEFGAPSVSGFASPHWKSNNKLAKVLKEFGFKYYSDLHGTKSVKISNKVIDNVSVNISGEPGGVGYFEYASASGMSDEQVIVDLFSRVGSTKYSIVYDHPYYSGVAKIALIEKVLLFAKKNKVKILTVDELRRKIKR